MNNSKSYSIVCRVLASVCVAGAAALAACSGTTRTGSEYRLTVDRNLEAYLPAGVQQTHNASLSVVRDEFGYTVTNQAVDAREGVVEARTARDDRVVVETFTSGDNITRVQVFVGPLGDTAAAREILAAIDSRVRALGSR